jgi:hypothetical protein
MEADYGFLKSHNSHRRLSMNRTKLAALLAAIALTIFAAGCGGDSNNANSGNASNMNRGGNMNMSNANK